MLKFLQKPHSNNYNNGRALAFMNQKGGVGKTTMAFNTAHALTKRGYKVLCIDMDPQGNFSSLFGVNQATKNIFHLLVNSVRELRGLHSDSLLSEVIHKYSPDLHLIPSGQELSGFELTVATMNAPRQLILKKFIEKNDLMNAYDYIVIDGPPTLGLIVVNIFCACQGIMYPFIADSFSKQGLKNIQNVLDDIEDMGIVEVPKNLGLVPNLFESRRKQTKEDLEFIKDEFNNAHVFEPFVNKANFARVMSQKKSVFDFEAKEFKELQGQFINMAQHIEQELKSYE